MVHKASARRTPKRARGNRLHSHRCGNDGYRLPPPPAFPDCSSCGGTGFRDSSRGFVHCPRCLYRAEDAQGAP